MLGLASATSYRVCSLVGTGVSRRVPTLQVAASHSALRQSSHQICSLCGKIQLGLGSLHESRADRLLLSGIPGTPTARRFRCALEFPLEASPLELLQTMSSLLLQGCSSYPLLPQNWYRWASKCRQGQSLRQFSTFSRQLENAHHGSSCNSEYFLFLSLPWCMISVCQGCSLSQWMWTGDLPSTSTFQSWQHLCNVEMPPAVVPLHIIDIFAKDHLEDFCSSRALLLSCVDLRLL